MNAAPELRVMQVSWTMRTGGLERVVLDLARLSPDFGVAPLVAAMEQAGELAEEVEALGIPFFLVGKGAGLDLGAGRRLARLVREHRVDVLHAHNQGALFYCGLAGLLTRRPVIYTRHGASWGKDASHRWLSRLGSRLARYVVCIGADAVEVARGRDRVPESKVRLIYNGADLTRFKPDARVRAEARAELGIGGREPVVMTVGRLSPEKDQAGLVKAMAMVPAARLVLVGDGPEAPALARAAHELGLAQRVILTGARRDVDRLLCAADVFALSSLSEGVSIAALEAMAAGLPVVATRVGGNPEIVEHGVTGLLVEPARPDELAGALTRLLAEPGTAAAMGRAGRRLAEEKFALTTMVGAYADLYREATGRRARG